MKVYDVKETAKELKCGKQVVYELIKQGKIKALKIGKLVIREQEIDRFLDELEKSPSESGKQNRLS